MAKKAYAVTNIKYGDGFIEANDEFDPSKFTRKELQELYDAGAVEVRDSDDPRNKTASDESLTEPGSGSMGELQDLDEDSRLRSTENEEDTDNPNAKPVSSAAAGASTKSGPEETEGQTTSEVVKSASTGKPNKAGTPSDKK